MYPLLTPLGGRVVVFVYHSPGLSAFAHDKHVTLECRMIQSLDEMVWALSGPHSHVLGTWSPACDFMGISESFRSWDMLERSKVTGVWPMKETLGSQPFPLSLCFSKAKKQAVLLTHNSLPRNLPLRTPQDNEVNQPWAEIC